MMDAVQEVLLDLEEQRKIGVKVPESVFSYVREHPEEIQAYRDNGMKIQEISDHMVLTVR